LSILKKLFYPFFFSLIYALKEGFKRYKNFHSQKEPDWSRDLSPKPQSLGVWLGKLGSYLFLLALGLGLWGRGLEFSAILFILPSLLGLFCAIFKNH